MLVENQDILFLVLVLSLSKPKSLNFKTGLRDLHPIRKESTEVTQCLTVFFQLEIWHLLWKQKEGEVMSLSDSRVLLSPELFIIKINSIQYLLMANTVLGN